MRQQWSITLCTRGFSRFSARASFMRMILTADQTFLLRPTGFSRVTETLTVVALHDRNW